MTVSDYINVIGEQRDLLKENLSKKGVSVNGCDTYNQLIPKVLEVQSGSKLGAQNGVWTPTTTTEVFNLTGLDFFPSKISICCEDVLTKNYKSAQNVVNVALINIELSKAEQEIIKTGSGDGLTVESGVVTVDIGFEIVNDKYGISISFENINKSMEVPYKFKANASHVWCVAEEGWLI